MRTVLWVLLLAMTACVSTAPKIDSAKMAEGYYMKGLSYFQEKNYELASVEFNRSIQTDSNFKQSYFGLGSISAEQGKLDEAIKYYKDSIAIDPNYSEGYNALGTVYARQQKWNEALKYFKKALDNKLYTTPNVPYQNMGRVYMAQKDYAKAVEAYRDAKAFVNQDYIIYELGQALLEAGRTKEAIAEFQEGVSLAPQNANIRYSLAIAYLKDGNKKAAQAEFEKVVKLNPKSEQALKANDYIRTLR